MNHYEEKMNRRIHYRLPPQCDMLELVPPRRSKMFLKWQDLRKRDPPPNLKPKPKDRLHIWQKVNQVKELNNLEDYYWFYEEWDTFNKKFMKRFNKIFPELLMERIHHHRIKMENAMLLVACISSLSEDENNDVESWQKNLRNYLWKPMPGVELRPPWDDCGTPKKRDDSRREDPTTDRVGRADRDNPKLEYFKDQWAHLSKNQDEWGDWEIFCSKMNAAIEKAESWYPDFTGLLILGKRMRPLVLQPSPPLICIEPDVPKKPLTSIPGPAALISLTYHFFVNQVGDQSIKSVQLENVGETVLFYTWERRPMENLITTPKVHLGPHITDCRAFSVLNGSGSIQSGEKKIFNFRFKSDIPGVFLESWILRIAPRLPIHWTLDPIFFKGVAFSAHNFEKLRKKLSQVLYFREMMSGIDEFFVDTLNRAAKDSRPIEEVRCARDYMFSSKAFNFLQKNLAMDPHVYYVPSSYQKLEAFATIVKAWEPPLPPPPPPPVEKIPSPKGKAPQPILPIPPLEEGLTMEELPWVWEGSFSSIGKGIEESTMSERLKQHFRSELATLKELVQIPPRQTMLLHVVVYKILKDITNYAGDAIEDIPEEFGRPMAETLMNKYYEKYEQQRLEKEAEAAARMEENPEAAEAEMMEMLLEQIRLENPPLNEISLESRLGNQEMLEMCFKWLHICTEMRMFMRVGFHDYEEQVRREQRHLLELMEERIHELLPLVDEMSAWDRLALERAKEMLVREEKELSAAEE